MRECVCDGRTEDPGPNFFRASDDNGYRNLDRSEDAPRAARPSLTKDLGFNGRPAAQRDGAVRIRRESALHVGPESIGMQSVERRLRPIVLIGAFERVEAFATSGCPNRQWIVAIWQFAFGRDDDWLIEPKRTKCIGSSLRCQHECRSTHRVANAMKWSSREAIAVQCRHDVVSHTRPRQPGSQRQLGHTMASQIEGHTVEPIDEVRRKWPKDPTVEAGGVCKEQRRSAAHVIWSTQIMQGDPHAAAGFDHLARTVCHGEREATWRDSRCTS